MDNIGKLRNMTSIYLLDKAHSFDSGVEGGVDKILLLYRQGAKVVFTEFAEF